MKLETLLEEIACEMNGNYTPYDSNRSVLIVPVDEHRFQRVVCYMAIHSGQRVICLESKVSELNDSIDLRKLLEENTRLNDAKFMIKNGDVLIGVNSVMANLTRDQLKCMMSEVARTADKWEYEFTGVDVN